MVSKARPDVRQLAQELADREGYALVDVGLIPGERKLSIRVIIHREGGVTLEDCRRFSEDFSALLDVDDAVRGSFVLEVSSPGITRPLRTPADFRRNIGREIEFTYLADGTATTADGVIVETLDHEFQIRTVHGLLTVPYHDVQQAKPKIDWRSLFKAGEHRHPPEEQS